jgi:excisionase family DNA binding protein
MISNTHARIKGDLMMPEKAAVEELLVSEAGRLARRSSQTIRRWTDEGRLPFRRVGGIRLIDRAALLDLIRRQRYTTARRAPTRDRTGED